MKCNVLLIYFCIILVLITNHEVILSEKQQLPLDDLTGGSNTLSLIHGNNILAMGFVCFHQGLRRELRKSSSLRQKTAVWRRGKWLGGGGDVEVLFVCFQK